MEISNQNQNRRRSQRRQDQRRRAQEMDSILENNVDVQQNQQEQQLVPEQPQQVQPQQVQPQQEQPQQVQPQQVQPQQQQQQQAQQQPNQPQKINPKTFLAKIPNLKVLRDFLVNKGKFYVPPERCLTTAFCKGILSGQKKLLKAQQVIWIDQVPGWPEFTAKNMWKKAQNNPQFLKYFPTTSVSQPPTRKYLLNVANTLSPHSVANAVIQIRKQREQEQIEDAPILLCNEMAQLLGNFQSISNDQRRRGFRNLRDFKKCPLCLSDIRSKAKKFKCNKHFAHQQCINQYEQSQLGRDNQYSCPMRCPK